MKHLAIVMLLLVAACSPALVEEPAPEVTEEELEGVDEVDAILDELDNLDAELDLDAELAALDADLQ